MPAKPYPARLVDCKSLGISVRLEAQAADTRMVSVDKVDLLMEGDLHCTPGQAHREAQPSEHGGGPRERRAGRTRELTVSEFVFRFGRVFIREASRECRRACEAAESEGADTTAAGPAVAAIILSEAALEAFIYEMLALLEKRESITRQQRTSIERSREFWKQCREFHDSLSGGSLSDKPVYENKLVPLVKLRHCVVHRAAAFRDSGVWPESISHYQDQIDHDESNGLHWTSQLFTCRTARWAVDAAVRVQRELHQALPTETLPEKFAKAVTTWVPQSEDPGVS